MKNEKNERKLRVGYKYQQRAYQMVKAPEIKLTGKWLKECGFKIGQDIKVQILEGKLVIIPE